MMFSDFHWSRLLSQFAVLVVLLGVPTFYIWRKAKGRLSVGAAYRRAILYVGRVILVVFAAVSTGILLIALGDQIGLTNFGYPAGAIGMALFFLVFAFCFWRVLTFIYLWFDGRELRLPPQS